MVNEKHVDSVIISIVHRTLQWNELEFCDRIIYVVDIYTRGKGCPIFNFCDEWLMVIKKKTIITHILITFVRRKTCIAFENE